MSFFQELDEPRPVPRREPPRQRPREVRRRPSGRQRQVVRRRRLLGAIGVVAGVLVLGVLVNSCQSSQRASALRDYDAGVASVMSHSDQTGRGVFSLLTSGAAPRSLLTALDQASQAADGELARARGLSVPDGLSAAQSDLTLALTMRRDAIAGVAANIQPALQGDGQRDAVSAIAAAMARLYASDVVYKGYVLPLVVGALHGDRIPVSGPDAQPLDAGQVVSDLRWLTPSFVASQLHVSSAAATPGTHGHELQSVDAAGTALSAGATLTSAQASSLTLNFSNTGQSKQTNVGCRVVLASAAGPELSGRATVPQTTPGQAQTCQVTLPNAPPAGSYTLTATVEPVPGEKDTANNTLTFPVAVR